MAVHQSRGKICLSVRSSLQPRNAKSPLQPSFSSFPNVDSISPSRINMKMSLRFSLILTFFLVLEIGLISVFFRTVTKERVVC